MSGTTFKQLIVWRKAKDLAIVIYRLTSSFPSSEMYGLTGQMRRAAVSISSNIAEGYTRQHAAERLQFWHIAYGSGAELESQMEIAKVLYPDQDYTKSEEQLLEIMKMLNVIVHKGPVRRTASKTSINES